jgi:DNA-binding NtrC family response regulator
MPQLIVSQNACNYRVVPFASTLRIGRDADNDLVLDSPRVSRHHGNIQPGDDGFYLTDSGSTNGIWRGNKKITSLRLVNGFTFKIVDFFLTFVDEKKQSPSRVFATKGTSPSPEQMEEKTIVLGLESFLPGTGEKNDTDINKSTDNQYADLLNAMHRLEQIDNEPDLFAGILQSSMKLVHCEHGFIATHDKKGDLVYRAMKNLDPDKVENPVDHGLIHLALNNRETVFRPVAMDQPLAIDAPEKGRPGLIFCAPFFFAGNPEGCLYLAGNDEKLSKATCKTLIDILARYGSTLLERIRYRLQATRERQDLKNRLELKDETIIRSEAMIRLYEDIRTIGPINVPVLILGEAGTGKELVASALHNFSNRQGACLTLNCSAIPEGIFESELFGSVKGAFHNAVDKPGKLEMAHNGTIFLDEIGDMAIVLQPKLLRFLENGEITRLGDTRVKKLDVRIIAATNRNLEEKIQDNTFREDLFQRLSCFILKVPPLRERQEDIEPLIRYFLKRFAREYNWPLPAIADPVIKALESYPWPGNIRELRNSVLRLSVQAKGKTITMDDLTRVGDNFGQNSFQKVSPFPSLEKMEQKYIRQALDKAKGNISEAAKIAGIARSTFYQKMKKFQITSSEK